MADDDLRECVVKTTANSAGSRQKLKARFCECGNEHAVFIKARLFAYKMSNLWLLKRAVCMNTVPRDCSLSERSDPRPLFRNQSVPRCKHFPPRLFKDQT